MADELSISVVIPVGPGEQSLSPMLGQLDHLQHAAEIVFVFCPESEHLVSQLPLANGNIHHLVTDQGRAKQMNRGAQLCTGDYLWFLHLDSRIQALHWQELTASIGSFPAHFHYFDLKFLSDGDGPMWLNDLGANLRSRWLGIPFGDQGFCLSATDLEGLQGYPQHAAYGEDHLLVWKARQQGIKLKRISLPLITSARKYADQGWFRLTLRYQWYWIRQAVPELIKLIRQRLLKV
ncbi:MAG: hypothetical protein OIF55_19310 [Amphritea sp.]|nr:hypothetical protein [Amphritea sp.]